ncbi:Na+/H+ antiporter [Mucilaginibacter sp. AK015]|uniref:Na+/H+ antiporter n=1 Tax=Mucilaginibacter sp. AK015 TaxID=2723072 RepID=UPI0016170323|nr:Na+/H+ antiporter [Mucilaginibacter sp. AK015]MBB5396403.1 CPA1 family monovalent cation:H+ antiporter [Mucilaginibacter sp. AK015]
MHQQLPFILALIAAIILIEMLASKMRVAYPVLLVVAGLLISFIPGLPAVKVDPNMIFFIFLPPLLFDSSWNISFKEMKKWWRIIGSFAFLVVLFSAFAVAVITNYFIPGFTLVFGFLLGGIVSPPDAVSTGAIKKFVKMPKQTLAVLEGESLLNDASSLIIFKFALIAVGTGHFVFHEAFMSFSWMIIGGIGIGLLFGWLFLQAHKRLPTDASSDIVLTLIEPYFLYWIAEKTHSSGVLAVVTGGLFLSTRRLLFLNSASRIKGYSVWESFIFVLNGIVFMIIGLELPEIIAGLRTDGIALQTAIMYGALVTAILIVARTLSSYVALLATFIFRPGVLPHRGDRRRMFRIPLLLGWTGMRGVVSLAAALAIPITLHGEPFPHRSLILFITFVVILLTLLVQGLTLPYIIKRFDLAGSANGMSEDEAKIEVRNKLVIETVRLLKELHKKGLCTDLHLEYMIEQWERKLHEPERQRLSEESKRNYIELLTRQRFFLEELNKNPELDEDVVRLQIYQIDLEEERIKLF